MTDPTQLHRDSFIFYRSFAEALSSLSDEDFTRLCKAIFAFALDGEVPSFDNPLMKLAWTLIEPQLRANRRKAFNGSKGGKSKPSNGKQGGSNGKQTQANVNDNENDNLNENGNKGDSSVSSPPPKPSLTPEQAEKFQKFNDWLKVKCPHVARMEKQLSFSLMERLMNNYGEKKVFDILRNMENFKKNGKPVEKSYTSVYQTANNWLKSDAEREGGNQ